MMTSLIFLPSREVRVSRPAEIHVQVTIESEEIAERQHRIDAMRILRNAAIPGLAVRHLKLHTRKDMLNLAADAGL